MDENITLTKKELNNKIQTAVGISFGAGILFTAGILLLDKKIEIKNIILIVAGGTGVIAASIIINEMSKNK